MWQVNYPTRVVAFFVNLRRIFLGEYIDDLKIGHNISVALGTKSVNDIDAPENKIGNDRIGSDDMAANFGPTMILGSIVLLLLIVILLAAVYISRT